MTDSYDDLVRFLNGLSDGDFDEQVASRLSKLLTFCWESFDGSSETSMAAHKIDGRARGFKWKSPILTFEIERHGGTVIGSTRADRQEWTIDVEKRTARPAMIGYRQLTPRASAFQTEPVVEHFVDVVTQRLTTPPGWNLTWISDDEIRVVVRSLLPDPSGFQKTMEGRTKRLRERLISAMAAKDWHGPSAATPTATVRQGVTASDDRLRGMSSITHPRRHRERDRGFVGEQMEELGGFQGQQLALTLEIAKRPTGRPNRRQQKELQRLRRKVDQVIYNGPSWVRTYDGPADEPAE